MRFTSAYYMLILYVTVMFKPFIPIIKDFLSHTFAEAIHVATVHATYGSNHLQKELSKESTANDHPNTLNTEEAVMVHVITNELSYNFSLGKLPKTYPFNKPHTLTNVFISKVGPPPKRFMD
jgi:hypothetical protein